MKRTNFIIAAVVALAMTMPAAAQVNFNLGAGSDGVSLNISTGRGFFPVYVTPRHIPPPPPPGHHKHKKDKARKYQRKARQHYRKAVEYQRKANAAYWWHRTKGHWDDDDWDDDWDDD